MTHTQQPAVLVDGGVAFTIITTEFTQHECIISAEALSALARKQNGQHSLLEIFNANEAKIRGVARRMVAARVKGSPLQLEERSFH